MSHPFPTEEIPSKSLQKMISDAELILSHASFPIIGDELGRELVMNAVKASYCCGGSDALEELLVSNLETETIIPIEWKR